MVKRSPAVCFHGELVVKRFPAVCFHGLGRENVALQLIRSVADTPKKSGGWMFERFDVKKKGVLGRHEVAIT